MDFFIKIYEQLSVAFNRYKFLMGNLFSFLFVKIYFSFIILLNLFLWFLAYYMYANISQDVSILHYNIDFGIDLIGNKGLFFITPLLGLGLIVIDKIVLLFLLKKDNFKFLAYFLLSFLLLFNILLCLSLCSIYLINF